SAYVDSPLMVHSNRNITRAPSAKPTSGEATIGTSTFATMLPHCTCPPLAKSVAPTSPPNNACDDEDGSPKYQVSRFHPIAPTTPAKTTPRLLKSWGRTTRPSPTVLATFAPKWAPTKLPTAATNSAI